jgi:UDP-N-acetylglucosamine/UDP-N-acetylgalactosamine diphosphorylase
MLTRQFVEQENKDGFSLPFHKAVKKVPFINELGERVEPDEKNGIKFETFVFDALGDTKSSVTLRTRREDEFAPVKNREGEDSPETSRQAMSDMYKRWLVQAGYNGDCGGMVELSPLLTDIPEELKTKLKGISSNSAEELENSLKGFYYRK